MAESTIREDVIKIIMDIDGDDELEKLKKQLTGTKEETDKVGKSKGFDGLKKSIGVADNAAKKMLGTLGKVAAKTAKLTFKATAAGITAGATAVGVLAKQAVGAYSEFEQLKGGVDTLFGAKGTANVEEYTKLIGTSTDEIKKLQKEAGIAVDGIIGKDTTAAIEKKYKSLIDTQDMVLKNANNAYKTSGLSANEYMNTVTSFSASLIQSVGGDTAKAAEMADMAIIDMSDNANKMGTDMGMIMGTYQSLARGNFGMLDNLKLGYGGTKAEMERLIKDAAKLDKSIDSNSMSYSNIVKAIHAVQDNMGITGTTAKEASTTIQGSVMSMKAAWGNLLPALIKGGDSFDQCVDNLIESIVGVKDESGKMVGGVLNNVMPALEKALEGIGTLVERVAPIIEKHLPELVDRILPPLIKAGTSLFIGVAKALPNIIKVLIDELPYVAKTIKDALVDAFGENKFITGIFDKLNGFFKFLKDNIETVKKVALGAGAAIAGIVIAVKGFKAIQFVSSMFSALGKGGKGTKQGSGVLASLANMKVTSVLKGMGNLAIIIGGLTLIAAALMKVAPYMAQLAKINEIAEVLGVIAALGLLGTGLAKLSEIVGKIPVKTVALGLANMAIMLGGLAAIAAAFLWLSPKIAALGDFESILQVVKIMGLLGLVGSGLSVLAGIIGKIPVTTVVLGLVNIAIALGGFGLITAAFLKLASPIAEMGDFKTIFTVIKLMGIVGIVGTVLAGLAGIVGMIPFPVVANGLADMALALGGFTAIIEAFGALSKIPGFTSFLETGGEVLTKISGILGDMVGSLVGGVVESFSDSLPTLGKNLGDFGTNIKPLFTAMQGVDMNGVGTFFTAIAGLLTIATGNDIVEGIKKLFGGGESSIAKLGTELSSFATNAKTFFNTVSELPDDGFSKATSMFDCLAGVKSLPKEGGVVGWFSGEVNYDTLSSGLASLANENVTKFFTFTEGLTENSFTMATQLFNCLAGIKSLPKDGGVAGWFSGEVNFSDLSSGLGSLAAQGVKDFFAFTSGLSEASFTNATKLFDCLASMSTVSSTAGMYSSGMISGLGVELQTFVDNAGTFFDEINGLKVDNIDALTTSMGSLSTATTDLNSTVTDSFNSIAKIIKSKCAEGLKSVESTLSSIQSTVSGTDLSGAASTMMDTFVSGIESRGQSAVSAMSTICTQVNQMINSTISAGNNALTQFGAKANLEPAHYARGTGGHKGGSAVVNDGRGAELVQMPNGNTFIPNGRNVFLPNAPKGMKVLDAQKTAKLFGKKSPTFRYAEGTGDFDVFGYDTGKSLASALIKNFTSSGNLSGFGLTLGNAAVSTVEKAMSVWAEKTIEKYGVPSLENYNPSGGVSQWKNAVIRALKMEGEYNAANVKRTLYQMQTESGGNPRAINNWDSNAKKGIPSKGLLQVIPPTFKAYARPGYDSNIYDPLSNILASVRYAKSRYGSLAKAYQGHGYSGGVGESGIKLPQYSPSGNINATTNNSTENNTFAPVFNLTISGSQDDRILAQKVKRWVSESIDECFESMARRNASAY